jgi:hypothetical protein
MNGYFKYWGQALEKRLGRQIVSKHNYLMENEAEKELK